MLLVIIQKSNIIQTKRIFSQDIGMEFEIEKYA